MKRAAIVAFSVALGLGLLDAVLRIATHPLGDGFRAVVNDPGKSFFHVFLLPPVIYLMLRLPATTKHAVIGLAVNRLSIAILAALAITATCFTYTEQKDTFFNRCATPEDISSLTAAEQYASHRQELWASILTHDGLGEAKSPERLTAEAYAVAREKILGPGAEGGKGRELETWANYFALASTRRYVADILALLGNLTACWLLFAIAASFKRVISSRDRDSLLLLIAALVIWMPLRLYSEWHHRFGDVDGGAGYGPLLLGAAFSLATIVILLTRASRSLWASWVPSASAIASIASVFTFKEKPDWFAFIAKHFMDADMRYIAAYHVLAFVFLWAVGTQIENTLLRERPPLPAPARSTDKIDPTDSP